MFLDDLHTRADAFFNTGESRQPLLEVNAGMLERVDEQVHQHRLAAPDASPKVETANRLSLAGEQLGDEARILVRL